MDTWFHHLDRHFDLPHIRTVQTSSPLQWLRKGWSDLRDNPIAGLAYGVCIAALGLLVLVCLADKPYPVTAAVPGFLLVGPVAAAGLYEISRRHAEGQRIGLTDSIRGLARDTGGLFYFGQFLAFVLLSWERRPCCLRCSTATTSPRSGSCSP